MNIELKKIHYSAALSQETAAYTAEIWVDGVRAGTVENDGHGGADMIHPRELYQKIYAYAQTLPPLPPLSKGDDPIQQNTDIVLGALLDRHIQGKRLKNLLKKRVVFVRGGKCFTAASKAAVKDGVVLNDLPFESALTEFLKAS